MNKVLVVGCGYAEIPIINSLKDKGYFVTTVGNNREGMGHRLADSNAYIDFSDFESVNRFYADHGYKGIVPGCNDFAVITAAYVAEQNGIDTFDSLEVTNQLHLKNLFRKTCAALKLSAPAAAGFDEIQLAMDYAAEQIRKGKTLIVKPIDLTGGKGIARLESMSEIEPLITRAFGISRKKKLILEEFIEGSHHGFSCLLQDGRVVWHFWDDEYYYLDNYSVAGTSYPGSSSAETLSMLKGQLEQLSSKLKLKDGLLHVQYIDKAGIPYIVEVMRRPPGDLYLRFVEEAALQNYTSVIVDHYLGREREPLVIKEDGYAYARHCIKGFKKGRVRRVRFSETLREKIVQRFDVWDNNLYLEDYLTQKLSIIILRFENLIEARQMSQDLYRLIEVEYYP